MEKGREKDGLRRVTRKRGGNSTPLLDYGGSSPCVCIHLPNPLNFTL